MSGRHFDSTEDAQLRAKIDEAKRRLPLPELMRQLGYDEKHIGKTALCPFHSDQHPSFSVFKKPDGTSWHKCFVGCSSGDEIAFLTKHFEISRREAIKRYLDMAGFPPNRAPKSHEYPKLRKSRELPGSLECTKYPVFHEYPVYPMSNGQGPEKALKALAVRSACTQRNTTRKKRWQLVRDLKAVEKGIGRELHIGELMPVFDEWYRLSHQFLDPAKTRDAYLAAFLAELRKVRVPTGEGDTIKKALEQVSTLPVSELPIIPGMPDAPESWRRLGALHRELSRRSGSETYFVSCRDAAKASPGLSHQTAYNINLALTRLGVLKIVRIGDARPNGKASKFSYILPQTKNGEAATDSMISANAYAKEPKEKNK